MINSKDIKNGIMQLLAVDENTPYVIGNGIIIGTKIAFDVKKLDEKKQKLATILHELGIDENNMIKLSRLTVLKNGEAWNNLQSLEDFQALELLLACSDACGFINNDLITRQLNINEIGTENLILVTEYSRAFIGDDDKWLQSIREKIVDKMDFFIDSDKIRTFTGQENLLGVSRQRISKKSDR